MSLLLWIGVFVISLVVLITAARYFTRSAEIVGLTLGMSSFATGVIIVALLPELISALIAVRKGASEIVAGNIIGSSISNLFLVMSLTTIFSPKPVRLGDQYIFIDLHFLVGAAFLLAIMMWDGAIRLAEGVLLTACITYMFYLLNEGDTSRNLVTDQKAEEARGREKVRVKDLGIIIVSAVFIFVGANYTITFLEVIAENFGISKAIISVTLLSLGTTLPEAVVSVSSSPGAQGGHSRGQHTGLVRVQFAGRAGIGPSDRPHSHTSRDFSVAFARLSHRNRTFLPDHAG